MVLHRESLESVAHKSAKAQLRDWLVDCYNPTWEIGAAAVRVAGVRESFVWKPNRYQRPHGVWLEYPWDDERVSVPWDEYERFTGWTGDYKAIPTLDEYRARFGGAYPRTIWDIAIQSQGRIEAAFEVVWRSDLTDRKRAIIRGSAVSVFTVSADWVLQQTRRPDAIEVMQRVEAGY